MRPRRLLGLLWRCDGGWMLLLLVAVGRRGGEGPHEALGLREQQKEVGGVLKKTASTHILSQLGLLTRRDCPPTKAHAHVQAHTFD